MSSPPIEEKIALAGGVEAAITDDLLAIVGQDIAAVPADLPQYAAGVRKLDFSFNQLRQIEHLDAFADALTSLVLDNNELAADVALPHAPRLETLWINNNAVADLDAFLARVRAACPALRYLSMLKNPACPNFFTGADSDAYRRYRLDVLRVLPHLKFLDSSPVTDSERAAVAPPSDGAAAECADGDAAAAADGAAPDSDVPPVTPEKGLDRLPSREADDLHASFGVSSYNYVGKHSEGNRFITNDSL